MALDPSTVIDLKSQVPNMGLAFALALVAGKIAKKIGVPKVTAFILIGILIGPGALNLLTKSTVYGLDFVNDIAFGLILFNIGGIFNRKLFEILDRRQVFQSLTFAFLIFTFVSLICFGIFSLTSMGVTTSLLVSLYLGVIAMDTAPPTTLFVLKEYESNGPLSNSILIYLLIGTLSIIIASDVFDIAYQAFGIWPDNGQSIGIKILSLLWSVFGSLGVGIILGFLLSYWEQKEKRHIDLIFAVACMIMFSMFVSSILSLNSLLISLALGFSVVNTSTVGEEIHKGVKDMGFGIYVLFFVLAGAHIDLKHQIANVGIFGFVYLGARVISVIMASKLSSKIFRMPEVISKLQGFSLLSHAGLALAIAHKIRPIDHPAAQQIFTIIISSIVFFEILGPLALKKSLELSGEASMGEGSANTTKKTETSLQDLYRNFIENVKLTPIKRSAPINSIAVLVKKDVLTIKENAPLSIVSKFVDEQKSSLYPVINDQNEFIGNICLIELRRALEEPDNSFILASKLIDHKDCLHDQMTLNEAAAVFEEHKEKLLPVVSNMTKKMIGTVSYKDLVFHLKESRSL